MMRAAKLIALLAVLAGACKRSSPADAGARGPVPPPAASPSAAALPAAPSAAAPAPKPAEPALPAWLASAALAELPAGAAAAFLLPLEPDSTARLRRVLLELAEV